MKKIRLTEKDLQRIVKRTISEMDDNTEKYLSGVLNHQDNEGEKKVNPDRQPITFDYVRDEVADYLKDNPEDLEGTWEVKDEVGGELIGSSTVVFEPQGQVNVAPPLLGLRWRLDPGPTHLDTCTFQVLSEDGTVLQYRGFIDRGARLEARFSKRPVGIKGSVMFQMRDGDVAGMGDEYWKDILPVNYKTGTTKFEMTKKVN